MLKISRKTRETIMIGDDIQIELVMAEDNRALIGIRAPKNVPVHRQEVYDKNKEIFNMNSKIKSKEKCL